MANIQNTKAQNIKVITTQDGKVNFVSPGVGFIEGYSLHHKDNSLVQPKKFILEQSGRKIVLLSQDRKKPVVLVDTETGANLGDFQVSCPNTSLNLLDFTPSRKWSNLDSESQFGYLFVSDKTLGNTLWDVRQNGKTISLKKDDSISYSKAKFSVSATSTSGQIAIGDKKGVVRLFSESGKKKKMVRAKTNLHQFATNEAIIGIDVSADGKWVLWTVKNQIFLCNTEFQDSKGERTTGFEQRMGKDKKNTLVIQLTQQDLQNLQMNAKDVSFTPAKFDNSPQSFAGSFEKIITTTCGPYVLTWKMRNVMKDYQKKRWTYKSATDPYYKVDRKVNIIRLENNIVADTFGYGNFSGMLSGLVPPTLVQDVQL